MKNTLTKIWSYCEECCQEKEADQLVKITLSTKKTSFILCKECLDKIHRHATVEYYK